MGDPSVQAVAVLGNYLPRQCGIATFTSDLTEALAAAGPEVDTWAMAMNDRDEGYAYPPQVHFEIHQDRLVDYRQAARFLDQGSADVLCLQHEFGIFGGPAGSHVIDLLTQVKLPVVTTLHTVLTDPNDDQRFVMEGLIRHSDRLVVMADRAVTILQEVYGVPRRQIAHLPHGIPDVPFLDPNYFKEQLGVDGQTLILTFGLLSPGKGIEYMIRAMPAVIREFPDVVYMVLGATHPHVLQRDGDAYRTSLRELAEALGVGEHVRFDNRFVPLGELCDFLSAAELYVTPYLGAAQIASGTLAYALGTGNAVISTPYRCAEELLADGRGILTPFRDPQALAASVLALLQNRVEMHAMRKRAYEYTREMVWPRVARRYLDLFAQVKAERATRPAAERNGRTPALELRDLPALSIDHLLAMTDDTGMLQHARFAIPQRAHGYCTDDNARALLVALRAPASLRPALRRATALYASFLEHAFNPARGRFRNFLTYERHWTEEVGSDDSHGRTMLTLGAAVELGEPDWLSGFAVHLFRDAMPAVESLTSPRAEALSILGLHAYLQRYPGDRGGRRLHDDLATRLCGRFEHATSDWPWLEDSLTYENARIPQALLQAGAFLGRPAMTEVALRALDWLMTVQTARGGHFCAVGNQGWYTRGGTQARFDQQPLEAHASLDACLEAYRATGLRTWSTRAQGCLAWFLGHNDAGMQVADPIGGGCRDGLHSEGLNENQGAESTVSWMLSLLAMRAFLLEEASSEEPPLPTLVELLRPVAGRSKQG